MFPPELFAKAAGIKLDLASKLFPGLVNALKMGEINTPARVAMFIAQTGHESAGFKHFKELGNAKYFARYNNRKDLGNGPKDGPVYYGRGPIQLTGRTNYRSFTTWANKRGININFENDPNKVAEPVYAWLAAVFYWSTRRLNEPSDKGHINRVTKIINGGFNGLADRKKRYEKATAVLKELEFPNLKVSTSVPVTVVENKPVLRNVTVGRLIEFSDGVYYVDSVVGRKMASDEDVQNLVKQGLGPVGAGSDELRRVLK
jgi:predicted chitinase